MKPLITLLSVFVVSFLTIKLFNGNYEPALAGRIAMATMLVFTGSAHFTYTKGMGMMLPSFVPNKTAIIYLTGIIEIIGAIGLFIPSLRTTNAWLLIIFFICVLPANIYAATKHIDYQKATDGGGGLRYLWFRIPLQLLFIVWIYFSAIKTF